MLPANSQRPLASERRFTRDTIAAKLASLPAPARKDRHVEPTPKEETSEPTGDSNANRDAYQSAPVPSTAASPERSTTAETHNASAAAAATTPETTRAHTPRPETVKVKRRGKGKAKRWYAVASGDKTGWWDDWDEMKHLVLGVEKSLHESFATKQEAIDYVKYHKDHHEGVKQKAARLAAHAALAANQNTDNGMTKAVGTARRIASSEHAGTRGGNSPFEDPKAQQQRNPIGM